MLYPVTRFEFKGTFCKITAWDKSLRTPAQNWKM